jgi:hypothetical protein
LYWLHPYQYRGIKNYTGYFVTVTYGKLNGTYNITNFPVSSGSQATFGKLLRVTGGYYKARTSSLKRVTKGFSKVVRDFIEGSEKYI